MLYGLNFSGFRHICGQQAWGCHTVVSWLGFKSRPPFQCLNRCSTIAHSISGTKWYAGWSLFVLFRLGYARITHGGLSDTEVQVGRFRFPQDLSSFTDNEHVTTDPQLVDEDVWFNSRWVWLSGSLLHVWCRMLSSLSIMVMWVSALVWQ